MKYFGDFLYAIDARILNFINVRFADPRLDQFWLAMSHLEREWWFTFIVVPLILIWLVYICGLSAWKPLLCLGLAVALADLLSYRVVKAYIQRSRPFEDPRIASWLRHVGDAHGASFPSNHAANCFAGAVVLAWFFPAIRDLFYIFALLVGISRIALGVHYPSDVLAGALLGILVGYLVRAVLLNRFKLFRIRTSVSSSDTQSYNWRKRIRRLEGD